MVGPSCAVAPSPAVKAPCGSKSTTRTFRPTSASAPASELAVVVLPTPPFWLHSEITRAGPCEVNGWGTGKAVTAQFYGEYRADLPRPRMRSAIGLGQSIPGDERVNLRSRNRRVPQHLLNDTNVGATPQQMSCARVAKGVGGNRRRDVGPYRRRSNDEKNVLSGQRGATSAEEKCRRTASFG